MRCVECSWLENVQLTDGLRWNQVLREVHPVCLRDTASGQPAGGVQRGTPVSERVRLG